MDNGFLDFQLSGMGSVLMDPDDRIPAVLWCTRNWARKAEKASKKMGGHGPTDQ